MSYNKSVTKNSKKTLKKRIKNQKLGIKAKTESFDVTESTVVEPPIRKWSLEQEAKWLIIKNKLDLKPCYLYITSSTTNSIFSLVDKSGDLLVLRSCGMRFRGTQKFTEVAHNELGSEVNEILNLIGVVDIVIFVKGESQWQEEALEPILENSNLNVMELKDITAVPFNGCRKWKYTLKNKVRRKANSSDPSEIS